MYKTIKDTSSAEVVEKKSKFIANLYYVENVLMHPDTGCGFRGIKCGF